METVTELQRHLYGMKKRKRTKLLFIPWQKELKTHGNILQVVKGEHCNGNNRNEQTNLSDEFLPTYEIAIKELSVVDLQAICDRMSVCSGSDLQSENVAMSNNNFTTEYSSDLSNIKHGNETIAGIHGVSPINRDNFIDESGRM